MKTVISIFILAAMMACGDNNNNKDPKKEAMEANKDAAKDNEVKKDMKDDMNFAVKAADDGMLEVALGQLAQQKGMSADIKELGKHMVDDHTTANNELKALAATKGITLPAGMSKDAQDKYDDLSKKSGTDFDEAYGKAMVKDHEDAIDLFQKESDKGEDPELKSWAAGKLSTLQHHKQMAEACCEKMDKK